MKRTVALVQARVSSTRFPGKVLCELDGVPMIVFMVRRAARAKTLDEVVVITSTDPSDDPLHSVLTEHGVPCLRGDLHDVLNRYLRATEQTGASVIVRLTGDCPLIDPAVIDQVVRRREATGADYASNVDPPSFPDGLDVECFTRAALESAHAAARSMPEREHVTLWMRSQAANLQRANVTAVADLSHLRLTVDYPDDLEVVRCVTAAAQRVRSQFDLFDALRVLAERPEIFSANRHVRNEGSGQVAGSAEPG